MRRILAIIRDRDIEKLRVRSIPNREIIRAGKKALIIELSDNNAPDTLLDLKPKFRKQIRRR